MTGAVLYHPVGDPEAQGAEAAGDDVGGIGWNWTAQDPACCPVRGAGRSALTSSKGEMVVGVG